MSAMARKLVRVGLGTAAVVTTVLLYPACSSDDCSVGILTVNESAPSHTDRLCGSPNGESLATASTAICELANCVSLCPTIAPRDPADVVTLASCQHVIPGRPPVHASSSSSSGGLGGFRPNGTGGLSGMGGADGLGGMDGSGERSGSFFLCTYEIETLFCS